MHGFPAEIQWQCVKDIIALVRKEGDMSLDEKLEVGQHIAWFWGSGLEWYKQRQNGPNDPDKSLIEKLLDLFASGQTYGSGVENKSPEFICDELEAAMPKFGEDGSTDAELDPSTVVAIVSLLIQLWKALR